jgi:hypothetical protein
MDLILRGRKFEYRKATKMKYTPPSVKTVSFAASTIQAGIEKPGFSGDSVHPDQGMNATAPGYEADE